MFDVGCMMYDVRYFKAITLHRTSYIVHRIFFTMFDVGSMMYDVRYFKEIRYIVPQTSYFVHCTPLVQHIQILHCSIRFSYFKLVHTVCQVIIPLDQIRRIAAGMTELLLQY